MRIANAAQPHLTAWRRALTCFELPVVWLAVGLLLLNDHYLKTAVPSWFTGKLSDFAGLFFFPLLLGLLFAPLGERLRLSYGQIGGAALGVTAVWFTLMKTNACINAATIAFWQSLVQGPVQIVRDPTDLIALVMLWPAWRVWRNTPHRPWRWPDKRLGRLLPLTAVAVASLAALATSCFDPKDVFRLVVVDGRLYVGAAFSEWPSDPGGHGWYVYACDADFNCEEELAEVSDDLWLALSRGNEGLVAACVDANPLLCYRGRDERVEFSANGGQTWQIAWQIPPGRREYMERVSFCKHVEVGLNDLLIIPDDNQDYLVVVAMGNEGILIRRANGSWERKQVGWETAPTPFTADNFLQAVSSTDTEYALWQVAWVVLLLTTFGLVWFDGMRLVAFLLIVIASGFTLPYFLAAVYSYSGGILLWGYPTMAVMLGVFSSFWRRLDKSGHKRRPFWLWFFGLVVGMVAFTPMLLWAFGTISYYDTAMTIVIVLGFFAILLAGYAVFLSWKTLVEV